MVVRDRALPSSVAAMRAWRRPRNWRTTAWRSRFSKRLACLAAVRVASTPTAYGSTTALHILLGAYRETLRLIALVKGPGEPIGLVRLPLELTIHPAFRLRAARLPAPLHLVSALLCARGLDFGDRIAAARFMAWAKRNAFRACRGQDCFGPAGFAIDNRMRSRVSSGIRYAYRRSIPCRRRPRLRCF